MKFPLWLASTVIAISIFAPTKAQSQVNIVLSEDNVRSSILVSHHHLRRRRRLPTRYNNHRGHRFNRRSRFRVYSPNPHRRRSHHRRYRGRRGSSLGVFIPI